MESIARKILVTYDEMAGDSLDLHTLLEMAGGANPAEREAVVVAVEQLVAEGKLRLGPGSDFYSRTEDGRIALAGPRDVTLYTRPGCHLCEEAKAAMAPILREFHATLREVNVDEDAALQQRFGNEIPVIFVGPRELARRSLTANLLRRQLEG